MVSSVNTIFMINIFDASVMLLSCLSILLTGLFCVYFLCLLVFETKMSKVCGTIACGVKYHM